MNAKVDQSVAVPSPVLGQLIPVSMIKVSPTNPRKNFNAERLQELASSVSEKGILEPLLVRPRAARFSQAEKQLENIGLLNGAKIDHYEIVAGERRFRAAKLAKLAEVPCIVRDLADKDALEIQLIENLQREDLNEMEEAQGYQLLIKQHGYTSEKLAEKVGKSKTFIYAMLKLNDLPEVAAEALASGKISKSIAELIARLPNEKMRERFAKKVLEGDSFWNHDTQKMEPAAMSLRTAKDLQTKDYMLELKGAIFSREDAELVPEAGPCSACPKQTANNRVLYPDSRGDICTDPACFRGKELAHQNRVLDAAKEKGLTVIKNKSMFSAWNDLQSKDYVELSKQFQGDTKKNKRSFKQLLAGSDVEVIGAIDRKGNLRRLVRRDAAQKVLKEKHKLDLPNASSTSYGYDPKAEAERRAKADREKAIRQKAADKAYELLKPHKFKATPETFRILVKEVLGRNGYSSKKPFEKCNLDDLVAIGLGAILADGLRQFIHGWGDWSGAEKILRFAKIDLKALAVDATKAAKAAEESALKSAPRKAKKRREAKPQSNAKVGV